jgi:hypothetical protein
VKANQRKRLTRWSQKAQDRAPAAFYTDRCALPEKPGGEHRPTDATMETGNGVTPYVLSETCWMTGAGANRMAYGEGFLKKQRPGVTPRIG